MASTIWKYELKTTDRQIVDIPADGVILCVQVQNEIPCIWAKVNPDANKEPRVIEIFGTGHPIHRGERGYIGTYQLQNGGLVFHVFEALK